MVDARNRFAPSAVRRSVIVALVSSAWFGIFFVASTQIAAIRARSPWDRDPWDAVISFTSQLVAAVAIITAVRCVPLILGTADAVVMRRILRGVDVITAAITVTVAVDVIALVVGAGDASSRGATPWLVDMLWITATIASASAITLVIAWRAIGRRSHRTVGGVPDPVASLATWTLALFPEPFDRPTVLIGLVAIAAGGVLSIWHTLVEGVLDNGPVDAILVTVIFAAIEALSVFALGCASAWYLEIFPANAARRTPSAQRDG